MTSKAPSPRRNLEPICANADDLYASEAREQIGRVLETWLAANLATPFELLHRPDLIRKLEASSRDLQHAFQKTAVPLALARGASVHEVMRALHAVVDQAIARILRDEKQGLLATLDLGSFSGACASADAGFSYRLAAGVAAHMSAAEGWADKVERLLALVVAAPADGPARALALAVLEPALEDLCGSEHGLAHLIGGDLEPGCFLLGLVRLAHGGAIDAIIAVHPTLQQLVAPLPTPGARLARHFENDDFSHLRLLLSRRALGDLDTKRRLHPGSALGEIAAVRGLAVALTAASGPLLPAEDVAEAILRRSERLVEPSFVNTLLHEQNGLVAGLDALMTVLESVTGDANRRRAVRFIEAAVLTPQFKSDLVSAAGGALGALQVLARTYRRLARAGAGVVGTQDLLDGISQTASAIDLEGGVIADLAGGMTTKPKKLAALQAMANGETAPPGPAARHAADALQKLEASGERVAG
ncbi:hypothetical protein [Phenylobacterium sp.]|uniref:hypothetical protein n=1 Tax=Phenylobacterium sp. TaxID=1871053 RepID=UPI0030F3B0AB